MIGHHHRIHNRHGMAGLAHRTTGAIGSVCLACPVGTAMARAITRGCSQDGVLPGMHMGRTLGVVHMTHHIEHRRLLQWRWKRHMDRHGVARPAAQRQQQDQQDEEQTAHG